MDFNVQGVQSHAQALGFDAISTYALPGGTKNVTYIIFLNESVSLYLFHRELHLSNYLIQLNGKTKKNHLSSL
jgi:hypothetical protein